MRIIAGEFRGRRIHALRGRAVRPTSDRVREAIFSILGSGLREGRVLDLFAGTGALGLEALSRGAASVVFVDESPDAVRLIHGNVAICGVGGRARVLQGSVVPLIRRLAKSDDRFDVVFLDPPYGEDLIPRVLPHLALVAMPEALVVAEHHVKDVLPAQICEWRLTRECKYGETRVSFYRRAGLEGHGADRGRMEEKG